MRAISTLGPATLLSLAFVVREAWLILAERRQQAATRRAGAVRPRRRQWTLVEHVALTITTASGVLFVMAIAINMPVA